ncbi:PTS transporter subunit EIIB [Mycoplasmopsis bovis]|uniref:PTS transporter subunit EIIB n=1 Tax=Mycoplasmopsis bovis TaxID=28903 RepID=UPI003F7ABDA1
MAKANKILDTNTEEYKQPKQIIQALGGLENISMYRNCATKLRYDIVNKDLVNETELINSGASAVNFVGDNHVQVRFGLKTVKLAKNIREVRDSKSSKNE